MEEKAPTPNYHTVQNIVHSAKHTLPAVMAEEEVEEEEEEEEEEGGEVEGRKPGRHRANSS